MKTRILLPVMAMLIAASTILKAQENPQEYLGLPGDNLNLYAVMKLFQESKTLEEFEKNLNDEKTKINNLDLNGDNYVDYIMVIDNIRDNVHYIVMRVAVSEKESQDVGVFTVERYTNGDVMLQLTGDEDLYGKNYIIEPYYDEGAKAETPNPGYIGESAEVYGRRVTVVRTSPVVIASWPIVTYIYTPGYVGWRSGWYWGYRPVWWNPWRPYYWHYYYGYHYHWYNDYYGHYRRWDTHRYSNWYNTYYIGTRVYSPVVRVNINTGHYRTTYSHPEKRKEGEDMYYKSRPQEGRRSTYSTTGSNSGRPSGTVNRSGRSSTSVSSSGREASPSDRTVNSGQRQVRKESTTTTRPSVSTRTTSPAGSRSNNTVNTRSSDRSSDRGSVSTSRSENRSSAPASISKSSTRTQPAARQSSSGSSKGKSISAGRSASQPKAKSVTTEKRSSSTSSKKENKKSSSESNSRRK